MNCQSFESNVSELAREQTMEASVREQAITHSRECKTCALKLEDERLLAERVRALAAEMKLAQAPARGEEQLLVAFRSHRVTTARLSKTNHRRYWVAVAAAVVLLLVGVIAMRVRPSSGRAPRERQIANQVEKAESGTVVRENSSVSLAAPKDPVAAPKDPRRHLSVPGARRHRNGSLVASRSKSVGPGDSSTAGQANPVAADSRSSSEIATEFFPVGYGSTLNLQDGGQLVRVELPRLALARFGLPVNVNRANQKVKADVLVGVDGLARAIRFVQ
jgi:hypothetical protein